MKRKITKILGVGLTLVMVLSLSIAMSLPVFAGDNEWTSPAKPKQQGSDGDWLYSSEIGALGPIARAIDGSLYVYAGIGPVATLEGTTPVWSTDQAHSGSSSVNINWTSGGTAGVYFVPQTGITVADLEDIDADPEWSFWYWWQTGNTADPQIELRFEDPDSVGWVDITLMPLQHTAGGTGVWVKYDILATSEKVIWYGDDESGDSFSYEEPSEHDFVEAVPLINHDVDDTANNWELTRVRMEVYGGPAVTELYVDDITIDGETYDLEGADGTTTPGHALRSYLMKSTDDGRTWEKTDYHKDLTDPEAIVDIVCSPRDADTLYVTDGLHVYITENGGDKWETVSDASLQAALGVQSGNQVITSVDVGYDRNDDPFVFIGTEDTTEVYNGDVYYVAQVGFPAQWTGLEVGAGLDVYAVAASPEFDTTREIFALVTDATPYTAVLNNINGAPGDWKLVGKELKDAPEPNDTPDAFESTAASRFCFPDDFDDDNYELFIGVCAVDTKGSVHRITDTDDINLGAQDGDIDVDVISLDIIGSYGGTTLIAGAFGSTEVFVSTDDGDNWDDPDKFPSGEGPTYVAMDEDFDDNGIAWAATRGTECAMSLTVDTGALYNQISLIATDIKVVESVSFSRKYATDDTMFMVTTSTDDTTSIWRHASDWERVGVSTLEEPTLGAIDMVQLSPDFPSDETVYVAESDAPFIYRSTDAGGDWSKLNRPPDALYGWVVIDEDTIIAGGTEKVYWTDNHGRRVWESETVTGAGDIMSFSLSPNLVADDTVLAGDSDGGIFISENLGEDWDQVGDDLDAGDNTFVTFDPGYADNNIIYAASGNEIDRCIIDTDEDWEDQTWKKFTVAEEAPTISEASGIRCMPDGTLYASDATAGIGVWRTINSTASTIGDTLFELMNEDLRATAALYSLQITEGSNVLWALDNDAANLDELWTYTDFLAAEVELDSPWSNTGIDDTSEVMLKWNELTGADMYELKYSSDSTFDTKAFTVSNIEDEWELVEDLDGGETYYWKVRVQAEQPLRSEWSRVWNFTMKLGKPAAPEFATPAPGAQDIILSPSFYWPSVSEATGYEMQVATDAQFTNIVAEGEVSVNSWVCDTTLSYSTGYYWRVRALKDDLVVSSWQVASFTTMPKAAAVTPPVTITPAPPAPEITITVPPTALPPTPMWVWAIIGIGGALVIAVIILIVRTRRAL